MSPLPQLLPHTRARVRGELSYWRSVLACWGYVIRPYDMLADRRRWRWQKPRPCGRQLFADLPTHERAALEAWVDRHREKGGRASG